MKVVRWLLIAILVICWGAWLYGVTAWYVLGPKIDYAAYYDASVRLLDGESIYNGLTGVVYLYPPLTAQGVTLSSAFFSREISEFIWHGFSVLLMLTSLGLLSYPYRRDKSAYLIWGLPLLFTPFIQSYWVGQVSMILLLCFVLAWFAFKHDKREWGGVLLALATWIKIYPVFILAYFVLRRDWRVVKGGLIGGVALLIGQLLISPRDMLAYFTEWLPRLLVQGQQLEGIFKNNSLHGFSQRLLIDTAKSDPLIHAPEYVSLLRWSLTLLLIVITIVVILRRRYDIHSPRFDLEYSVMIVVALLFGSTLWTSGMPPLILAYIWLIVHTQQRWRYGLIALSFALVTWMLPSILAIPSGGDMAWATMSVGFFGTLLLWLLLIWEIW